MEAVLLVIHLIVALAIIAVVLVQPSEAGGFLGSSGSMSNLMAPRRGADLLTRTTAILACCFFLTSLLLAIMAEHRAPAEKSILDLAPSPPAAARTEAPAAPAAAPAAPLKAEPSKAEEPKAEPPRNGQPKKARPAAPISQ